MSYFYQALVRLHVAPTEELSFLWWDDQPYWEPHEDGVGKRIQIFVDAWRLAVLDENVGPAMESKVVIQHKHTPRDMAGNPATLYLEYVYPAGTGNTRLHSVAIVVEKLFEDRHRVVPATLEEDRRRIRIAVLKLGTQLASV